MWKLRTFHKNASNLLKMFPSWKQFGSNWSERWSPSHLLNRAGCCLTSVIWWEAVLLALATRCVTIFCLTWRATRRCLIGFVIANVRKPIVSKNLFNSQINLRKAESFWNMSEMLLFSYSVERFIRIHLYPESGTYCNTD